MPHPVSREAERRLDHHDTPVEFRAESSSHPNQSGRAYFYIVIFICIL